MQEVSTGSSRRAEAPPASELARPEARLGAVYAIGAFTCWGLITIYFKSVAQVPALEVLACRVLFSTLFLWVLLVAAGRVGGVFTVLRSRRGLLVLSGSTSLIACNWLVFIWAVGHSHITQASLGYFINPLLNVLLGYLFLGERLRPMQKLSVVLAAIGVGILTLYFGEVPTIALVLPASFGLYGLIRKVAHVDALVGLAAETTLLTPLAAGYLVALAWAGRGHLGTVSWQLDVLLASAGVITAVPLIWFIKAARRLRLSTMGFLQYITPTMQLAIGVVVYGEAFTPVHLLSFGLVWAGLAVYAVDAIRRRT